MSVWCENVAGCGSEPAAHAASCSIFSSSAAFAAASAFAAATLVPAERAAHP